MVNFKYFKYLHLNLIKQVFKQELFKYYLGNSSEYLIQYENYFI